MQAPSTLNKYRYTFVLMLLCFFSVHSNANTSVASIDAKQANLALKSNFSKDAIRPEIIILRATLGQFDELDRQFDVLAANYYRDATYELALKDSFYNATEYYGVRLSDLNAWVNKTQSAYAYAARGHYYSHANVFDETREKYRLNAYSDFQQALSKSPKLSPVYAEILHLSRRIKLPLATNEIFEKALAADPRSFYVRYQYMITFAPSLNNKQGSAEVINKLAAKAQSYATENPRLYTFLGDIHADKAVTANDKNDCNSVVLHYAKAFEYGERLGWLEARAACFYRLGKKAEAKLDYDRILYYDPTNVKAGEWSRWIKKELRG